MYSITVFIYGSNNCLNKKTKKKQKNLHDTEKAFTFVA
jgi:hypothetical protein